MVNLETGIYYSIRGSGIDIWRAVEAGLSEDEIHQRFSSSGAEAQVRSYLAELERERLVIRANDNDKSGPAIDFSIREPIAEPVLEKFTDMREMLLIDPIHELDESGWPRKPETR